MTTDEFAFNLREKSYPEEKIASILQLVMKNFEEKSQVIATQDKEAYLSFVLQMEAAFYGEYVPDDNTEHSTMRLTVADGEDEYRSKFEIRE